MRLSSRDDVRRFFSKESSRSAAKLVDLICRLIIEGLDLNSGEN